jgi:hypothetical protein
MTSTRWLHGLMALASVLTALAACSATDLPLGDVPMAQAGTGATGGAGADTGGGGSSGAPSTVGMPIARPIGPCAPLDPSTTSVALVASDIVDAGQDTDGTVYVLTDSNSVMRLFVGASGELAEEFEAGTGQGNDGTGQFWTFQYMAADGSQVTVEVQKDASGLRMGVAKGPISGKGFTVGQVGSVLTPIAPAVAAAMQASSTQTYHVEYIGSSTDETAVVIAPDHADSYEAFRLFIGPLSPLYEQSVQSVGRGLSIGAPTIVDFTFAEDSPSGAPAVLSYASATGDASLTVGSEVTSFHGPVDLSVPAGTTFLCFSN